MMNISVIWVPSILTTKILENSRYKKEMKVIAVDVKLLTAITFISFLDCFVCYRSGLTKMIQPYIVVLNRTLKGGADMFFWDQHKTITSCYEMKNTFIDCRC